MNATTTANGAEPIAARMDTTPLRFAEPRKSEISNVLGSAPATWRKQRDRLDELEAAYKAEWFRVKETYERKLRAMRNEGDDALRELELKHVAQMADEKRMLAAFDALRNL